MSESVSTTKSSKLTVVFTEKKTRRILEEIGAELGNEKLYTEFAKRYALAPRGRGKGGLRNLSEADVPLLRAFIANPVKNIEKLAEDMGVKVPTARRRLSRYIETASS